MRRPLTWSIAAGAAACLILLLRCKNRAKAHKFNPSKLQNHDSFSLDLVLHLSRKCRKHQPQGSPFQPPSAPYVPSRCRKLRQRSGVLRNRGLHDGRSRRNRPEPLWCGCLQHEYLLGERVLIRSSLLTARSLRSKALRNDGGCCRATALCRQTASCPICLTAYRLAALLAKTPAPPLCRGSGQTLRKW